MNFAIIPPATYRPLFIDFNQYTDGDAEFKKELIHLMIDNLKEVQASLSEAIKKNQFDLFERSVHKIAPTLSMLDDKDLIESIQTIKSQLSGSTGNEKLLASFTTTCMQIIKSLEKETR